VQEAVRMRTRGVLSSGYAVAVAAVAGALMAAWVVDGARGSSLFSLLLAAVTLAASYGGVGPALVATWLSVVVVGAQLVVPGLDPFGAFRDFAVFSVAAAVVTLAVAARKRAIDEMRRSQQQLTNFVEDPSVGMLGMAGDGRILWADQAELDLMGYARDEYVGRNLGEYYVDRKAFAEMLERLARGEGLENCEARLRGRDRTITVLLNYNRRWRDRGVAQRGFLLASLPLDARREAPVVPAVAPPRRALLQSIR
jgi:PAS domain S-box-containing protein